MKLLKAWRSIVFGGLFFCLFSWMISTRNGQITYVVLIVAFATYLLGCLISNEVQRWRHRNSLRRIEKNLLSYKDFDFDENYVRDYWHEPGQKAYFIRQIEMDVPMTDCEAGIVFVPCFTDPDSALTYIAKLGAQEFTGIEVFIPENGDLLIMNMNPEFPGFGSLVSEKVIATHFLLDGQYLTLEDGCLVPDCHVKV